MRWGSKKQQPGSGTPQSAPEPRGAETPGRKSNGKGSKAFSFSFSPLSWLAKLAPKPKDGTKQAPASAHEDGRGADAAPAFPSCVPERTSPAKVAIASVGRKGSPRRSPAKFVARRLSVGNDNADAVAARGRHRSPAKAAEEELVPRRLSVGVDNADAVAARRHRTLQRHHSIGGDRDIKTPLGHLIHFSLATSPAPPPPPQPAPSDTDAGSARPRRRRRGHGRSLSGGRRSSFSGRMTLRVKVRSSRRAGAGAELEGLAVVRRTRDPQRAFRESMSEMIATSGGRPDELERLLACYLALNADEHHGCIVKVFRQVWFDHVNGRPAAAEPAGTTLRPTRAGADVN
uniref:Uncharacterized protein n=1 Tax=Avena sativa TaxID=4498 RepID=A0ACD5TF19_AVESA